MRLSVLTCAICALSVSSVAAQDQDFFGAGLAFAGNDLVVVKRAAARGPAALFVYQYRGGAWIRTVELRAEGAVERGLALSGSIAASDSLIVVGSGDPDGRIGAHAWRRGGQWVALPDLMLDEAPAGEVTVTLATVMQILSPAPRAAALAAGRVVIGFNRQAHTFRRSGQTWERGTVPGPDNRMSRGAAVATGQDLVAVGTPLGGAGSVSLLEVASGDTTDLPLADADSVPERSRFGTALAVDGRTVVVGAPNAHGSGMVLVYERREGGWEETARFSEPGTRGFGTVVALRGDLLLVSAPQSGQVFRYERRGGAWHAGSAVPVPEAAAGGGFGLALAIGAEGFAVGAPFAAGGRGRVWVYQGSAPPAELAPPSGPGAMTGGEIRCDDGAAGGFACHDVDLEAFLPLEALGAAPGDRVSDVWGWTDPVTGQEYALVGVSPGLVFVDVTNAEQPVVVGMMPANPSGARDIKVYRDHAFMTGDGAGQHGLMVFDLTRLRGYVGTNMRFTPDTVYRGIASAHNLALDTASGLAVPVSVSMGGETCGGGLHMVDIRNPGAPVFAGCYTDTEGLIAPGRTHDAQCVLYHGPDTAHQGRSICFASNETALRIVDVTDRANPVPLSAGRYPGAAYIHQGWLTEDHRYFYLDDELDELVGTTDRTRTMIWDVSDLDDPVMVGTYLGPDGATDHNLYVKGDRMYQANYQAGLRVVDISDPEHPREVGYFDTTPYDGNPAGFYGAWTAYPFFGSGTVIVSSMQEGLFILRPRRAGLVP